MNAKKQKSNFKPSSSSSFTKNPIKKTFYDSFITTKNKNIISTTRGSTTYQLDKRLSLRKNPFSKTYMNTDGNTKESPMQIKSIFTVSSKVSPSSTLKLQREHRHAFSVTEKKRSQSEEATKTLKGKKNNSVSHFYIPSINLIFQCDKKKEECDISNKTFNIKSRKTINERITSSNNMNKTHSISNLNHHYHCATLSSSIKSTTTKRPSIKAYKYPVISVLKRVHASSSTHSSSTNTSNKKIISIMQIADKIITNTHAPSYINTETKNSKTTTSKNYSVVNIVIKSNWGNKTKTGITEVQLYDHKHRRIPIAVCHVFNGSEDNIGRIHNGKFHSLNDTDMWTTPMSNSPIKIEISILNNSSNKNDVEDIVIWNYNGKDVNKGIKEIEVWKRNVIKWKGIVPKGAYNKKSDYSFKIKLNNNSEVNRITNIAIKNNKGNISNRDSNNFVRQRNHLFLSLYKNNKSNNSVNNLNSNKVEFVSSIVSDRRSDNNLMEEKDINVDYVSFNKITIVLNKSYNNTEVIGLTGIAFFDKDNKQISIDGASAIGALPKDYRTFYNDEDDYRIFENVFNGINNTIDENNMWVTVNKNKIPYLELVFQEKVHLSSIVFYNYNSPFDLDKGVREVTIIFDDDNNIVKRKTFLLRKGTGYILRNHSIYDENFLCGQRISFTNDKTNETISRLTRMVDICTTKQISVPCGYMIKAVLLSIYDDDETVRINSMKFYDIENEDISSYTKISILKYGITNENEKEETQSDLMYIERFDNYKKNPYSLANNIIVFHFDVVVDIGYIYIQNCNVRDIQLYIDDILIFEGRIKKEEDNYILFHKDDSCIKDTSKIVNVSYYPKGKIDESVNDNIKQMTLSQV